MKKIFVLIFGICLFLIACGNSDTVLARDGSGGNKGGGGKEKPTPDVKIIESIQPLILQKPVLDPNLFSNVMVLEISNFDQAWFSFLYTPKTKGSLFFTVSQAHLTLDCANSGSRSYSRDIIWQEVAKDGARKVLKRFDDSITEYEFQANKTYILSYVLEDLKKNFSDCKKVTLKFAIFSKNY